jgi:hypothetical protein
MQQDFGFRIAQDRLRQGGLDAQRQGQDHGKAVGEKTIQGAHWLHF